MREGRTGRAKGDGQRVEKWSEKSIKDWYITAADGLLIAVNRGVVGNEENPSKTISKLKRFSLPADRRIRFVINEEQPCRGDRMEKNTVCFPS